MVLKYRSISRSDISHSSVTIAAMEISTVVLSTWLNGISMTSLRRPFELLVAMVTDEYDVIGTAA